MQLKEPIVQLVHQENMTCASPSKHSGHPLYLAAAGPGLQPQLLAALGPGTLALPQTVQPQVQAQTQRLWGRGPGLQTQEQR